MPIQRLFTRIYAICALSDSIRAGFEPNAEFIRAAGLQEVEGVLACVNAQRATAIRSEELAFLSDCEPCGLHFGTIIEPC